MDDLEVASEEAVEEAGPGEEEEEMDASSVENPGISPENAQRLQEDLELDLERASVTTVTRLVTLLESAVLPGKEGSNVNSGLHQTWRSNVHY